MESTCGCWFIPDHASKSDQTTNNTMIYYQYLRDEKRRPFGILAATPAMKIGFSLCNRKDQWNRDLGRAIAIGRAGHADGSTNWVKGPHQVPQRLADDLDRNIARFRRHAEAYYAKKLGPDHPIDE